MSFSFYRRLWLTLCLILVVSSAILAQKSVRLVVKGLREPVDVLRDKWGVNHIYAKNEYDLFFSQGYTAAKDRLFQFEIWRRRATGTVAEILGPREVTRDIGARLFKYRGDLTAELDHYHPRGEMIINAYVDGVNALIEEVLLDPANLPVEFQILGIKPEKWIADVVVSRHQGLLGNINEELAIGMAVARVGEEKVKEVMWFHPREPDISIDSAIRGDLLSFDILSVFNSFRRGIYFRPEHLVNLEDTTVWIDRLNRHSAATKNVFERGVEGSNNWVVSGSKTESGYPVMANDPHRAVTVPSLRYMVHLVAPGWNVIGGGEPVIPGVSIGHNEYGAWGLTIYDTDAEDLYVYDLNPDNLKQYNHKGAWVDMEEVQDVIRVKGEDSRNVTLRYTLHGPVTFIDSVNYKAYAMRCGWLEPGGAPYLASLRMDQARTWEEFREACSYSHIPGENMVWADREGNIGWQVVGIVPVRKNFSGMVPVPGDGRYEWDGYLPVRQRPHAFNPDKGFIATANQNVTPENYTLWNTVGFTWADPYRGDRINEVLSVKSKYSMNDMKALQTDYFSIPARSLVPMLKSIDVQAGITGTAKQKLLEWDYVLAPSSIPAGIYVMWERQILKAARERFEPEEISRLVSLQLHKVIQWLQQPGDRFGVASGRDEFLRECFEKAVTELTEKLGPSIDTWQYGQAKYKHATLVNSLPAMTAEGMKEHVNLGPVPRGGNSHTPNATGGYDQQSHGASFRMIVDVGDWDRALMVSTPGQSGDPSSRYYGNLFDLWSHDGYFPAYYSKKKIKKVTEERYRLKP